MASAEYKLLFRVGILLVVVVASIIIDKLNYKQFQWHFLPILIVSLYMLKPFAYSIFKGNTINEFTGDLWVNALFYVAFYILFAKEIVNRFNYVTVAEQLKDNEVITESEFGVRKGISYVNIMLVLVGVFCVLVQWIIDLGGGIVFVNSNYELRITDWTELAIVFVCILILVCLIQVKNKQPSVPVLIITIIIFAMMVFFEFQSINAASVDFPRFVNYQVVLLMMSSFAMVGYPILIASGFYRNMVGIRNVEDDGRAKELSIILLLGGEAVSVTNTILLVTNISYVSLILVLLSTVLVCVAIPCLLGKHLNIIYEKNHVVPNTWWGGILQDGFSAMLVQLLLIGIPCIYIGRLGDKSDIGAWVIIIGLIGLAMGVVGFYIHNNVEHVERQRGVLEKHPNEKQIWCSLRKNLIIQNWITVFMTLPYFMLAVLLEIARYITSKNDMDDDNRIIRQLLAKYIDYQRYRETYDGKDGKKHYCFDAEEKILARDEVADCFVTKLDKKDQNGKGYLGIFVICVDASIPKKNLIEKIGGIDFCQDDKKWMLVFSFKETFLNYKGERKTDNLKNESGNFFDQHGKEILL